MGQVAIIGGISLKMFVDPDKRMEQRPKIAFPLARCGLHG